MIRCVNVHFNLTHVIAYILIIEYSITTKDVWDLEYIDIKIVFSVVLLTSVYVTNFSGTSNIVYYIKQHSKQFFKHS